MNIWLTLLLWLTYLLSLYFSVFWFLVFLEHAQGFFERRRKPLGRKPLVSIIVPARNEEKTIQATLQSIIDLAYPSDLLEIIVVCNASTDSTLSVATQFKHAHPDRHITIISHPQPGKGRALNTGLRHCHGEYFACLDADSLVDSQTLVRMLATFESARPDTVIVTPAMKIRSPHTIWQRLQRVEYLLSILVSRLMATLDCQYVAPGPFSLYKTSAIQAVGGFDEHNITEDMEIAYRIQQQHLGITHCPDAWVSTIGPSTAAGLYRQRNRWFKGGLLNAIKYRHMLGNRAYGDFGVLQMTINFLMFFFCLTAILFFGYYLLWPIFKQLYEFYLIGFDIWPLLTHIKLRFSLLYIDMEKVFIANFIMLLTLIFLWISHKNAQEPLTRTRWTIIPYIFAYYLVLSLIALVVVAEVARGKQQQW